jgi:hypothetical protein
MNEKKNQNENGATFQEKITIKVTTKSACARIDFWQQQTR